LFLLFILFNGYEFAYFFPGINTVIKTQTYIEPYRFNIILMAAGAMILTFLVFISFKLFRKKKEFDLIKILENNFPGLRIKLSTAYDNKQNLNIVTKNLFEDVRNQLNELNIKSLAPRNQIFRSFAIFLLFSGVLVYCINQGFSFDISPSRLMEKIPGLPGETASGKEEKAPKDIEYKVDAVIIKNGEKIEMEINPTLGLGFTNQIDTDANNKLSGDSSSIIEESRYSQTYSENLPEEYEPLIKQYFEKLSS
ncbi:MAG: hypothetical protein QG646_3658, partial [Euryarchaeota archaeon]|nr:hypothetical protein [Euryarchaeota archaeon]